MLKKALTLFTVALALLLFLPQRTNAEECKHLSGGRIDCGHVQCNECGYIYESDIPLSFHEQRCVPYCCDICNRTITETSSSTHNYTSTWNNCITTYTCTDCGHSYETSNHLQTTTGFPCQVITVCVLCDEVLYRSVAKHNFVVGESCGDYPACSHCGELSDIRTEHIYESTVPFLGLSQCTRCRQHRFSVSNINWFFLAIVILFPAIIVLLVIFRIRHRAKRLFLRSGARKKHSLGEKICAAALIASILAFLFFSPSILFFPHEHDFAYSNCTTLKCRDCDATTPMETPCHIFIRVDCETAKCSTCGVIAEDISIHEPKCSPYTCEICNRYIAQTQAHQAFCTPYTCEICGVRVSKTIQYYHDYETLFADSCTTHSKCRLCSEVHTSDHHTYEYSNTSSCAPTRKCTVCQKDIPNSYPYHSWRRTECGQSMRCAICGLSGNGTAQHVYQTRLFGSYTYCIYCNDCNTFNPENLNWFSVIYFACGLAVFIATMLLALKHRDRCSKVNWTATNLFLNDPSPDAITVTTRHFSVAVTLAHTLSALKEDSEIPND